MKKKLDKSQTSLMLHISISMAMLILSGFFLFGMNSLFEAEFFSTKWFLVVFSTFISFGMLLVSFAAGFINLFNQVKGRPNLYELIAQKLKRPR